MASSSTAVVPVGGKRKATGSSAAGFDCPVCGLTCSTRTTLKKHTERKHSEERNHVCRICNFASKTHSDNLQHESTCLYGTNQGKVIVCTVCKMELVSVEQFKNHKKFTRHKGYEIEWPYGPSELGRVLDVTYARSIYNTAHVSRIIPLGMDDVD